MMRPISWKKPLTLTALLLLTALPPASAQLGPKDLSDIVNLSAAVSTEPSSPPTPGLSCSPDFPDSRIRAFRKVDGAVDSPRYVVPRNASLVVTSFQFWSFDVDATNPEANVFHSASVSGVLDGVGVAGFNVPGGIADARGSTGSSMVMPTGVVFPPGSVLCMDVASSDLPYEGIAVGVLQGYLAKDK